MYQHPGVYIEHVPSGALSIEAASTSVAAFIGPVKRGPVGEPVFVSSASQFAQQFGPLSGPGGGIRDEGSSADYFGHAVNAFFSNGGTKAYIVRVAPTTGTGAPAAAHGVVADPTLTTSAFEFTAKSAGTWANALVVRLSTADAGTSPDLSLGYDVEVGIMQDNKFVPLEFFGGVELADTALRALVKVVTDSSSLVSAARKPVNSGSPISSKTLLSAPLDSTAIGSLSGASGLPAKVLEVKLGTGNNISVTFTTAATTLEVAATEIQNAVRADATHGSPSFIAKVVSDADPAKKRLHLLSGVPGRDVTAPAVATSTGRALLKFDANSLTPDDPPITPPTGSSWLDAPLSNGTDGNAPAKSDYVPVFEKLRDYRDISIMLLPGKTWIEGGDNSVIEEAITHAEFMQNRMVIVDPEQAAALVTPKDVKDLGAPTSPYTALYYPWLEVVNPHYDKDTAANKPKTFKVPPSSFGAGMWARIDGTRGVWKAPAELEATVRGSLGPTVLIGNDLQDNLNEWGVNCLRAIIGPTVIWGARTLATKTKPEFRYIPVRRTQSMIGESLYNALQAVVFEPNDHRLWASLRAGAGTFMDGLHRSGAFQGAKASEAYYVLCGLGSTMTQGDVDAGIVRVVVGFAPLKPAEFVVVQIQQIVGRTA